jgi:hypothetical protein
MRALLVLALCGTAHADVYQRFDAGAGAVYASDSKTSFDSFHAVGGNLVLAAGGMLRPRLAVYGELSMFAGLDHRALYPGLGIGAAYLVDRKTTVFGSAGASILWFDVRSGPSPLLAVGAARSGFYAKLFGGVLVGTDMLAVSIGASIGITVTFR